MSECGIGQKREWAWALDQIWHSLAPGHRGIGGVESDGGYQVIQIQVISVRFNLGEPMVGFVVFKQVKAYILDVDLCVEEQKTYLRQMEMVMNAFLKNN